MASGLLKKTTVRSLALAFACSTTGCLALQDQPYIGDFPVEPTVNHPPVILESLVEPQRAAGGKPIAIKTGTGCPTSLSFKIRLFDTDVNDELVVRWYVDYDAEIRNGTVAIHEIDPGTSAVRGESSEYTAQLTTPGVRLGEAGDHLVEAMVSDSRDFTTREEPFQPPAYGEIGPSPRTTYAWFVRTEVGVSCP